MITDAEAGEQEALRAAATVAELPRCRRCAVIIRPAGAPDLNHPCMHDTVAGYCIGCGDNHERRAADAASVAAAGRIASALEGVLRRLMERAADVQAAPRPLRGDDRCAACGHERIQHMLLPGLHPTTPGALGPTTHPGLGACAMRGESRALDCKCVCFAEGMPDVDRTPRSAPP